VRTSLLCALLCACAAAKPTRSPAAPSPALMALTETDGDGNSTSIEHEPAQVDLSSDVKIALDKQAITQRAAKLTSGDKAATLVQGYGTLLKLIQAEVAVGDKLAAANANASSHPNDPAARAALEQARKAARKPLLAILEFVTDRPANLDLATKQWLDDLTARLNAALDNVANQKVAAQYLAVHQVASGMLSDLQSRLTDTLKSDGVYFQLGAWLSGGGAVRPLNVPGFDTYPPGTRVDYDRWKISFSPEVQQQFANYQNVAKAINTQGVSATLIESLKGEVNDAVKPLHDAAAAVRDALQKLATAKPEVAPSLATFLASVQAFDDAVNAFASKTGSAISSGKISGILADPSEDLADVIAKGEALAKASVDFAKRLGKPAAGTPEAALLDALKNAQAALEKGYQTELAQLVGSVKGYFGVASDAAAAVEFGEQVKRLTLDTLPAGATLSLPMAGARNPGDRVIVEFAIGHAGVPADSETRNLILRRILLHVETTAGLIFASQPMTATATSRFQAAAAYSVLLKFGLRDSSFWDSFFRPGVGINVAALDFAHTGTPQLGAGVVLTLFSDILQGGFGYNIFADRFYGFFGIGLPLPTFGGAPGVSGSTSPSP
jgi:hypothetical protein